MEAEKKENVIRDNDDLKKIVKIVETLNAEDTKKILYYAEGMAAAYESREALA